MQYDTIDRVMMERCIALSRSGMVAGELPFGSLVARDGQIVCEAINEVVRKADESRHAEIIAIARARELLGDAGLADCTLYSNVEPCVMCSFCIRAAGIRRIVFALGSPVMGGFSGWNVLGDTRLSNRIPFLFGPPPEVCTGLLADEAQRPWSEWRPVVAQAIKLLAYLVKPDAVAVANPEHRFSPRRLIGRFMRFRWRRVA
jgi:tRNA(adenine34) deaminase